MILEKKTKEIFGNILEVSDNLSPMKVAILNVSCNEISNCVEMGTRLTREKAIAAISICRRKFRIEDIVLMVVLDEAEEGEAGIVFTEKGIYYWLEDEGFVAEIPYGTIKDVDYDEEYAIITTTDNKQVELLCGGEVEDKYSRYMYNYIMDLKEAYDECVKKGDA